jgi:hypothetical protein
LKRWSVGTVHEVKTRVLTIKLRGTVDGDISAEE